MLYQCIKKCFHRDHLYAKGDLLVPLEGEVVPHHFKNLSKKEIVEFQKKIERKPEGEDTFHGIDKQMAKAALSGDGHGVHPDSEAARKSKMSTLEKKNAERELAKKMRKDAQEFARKSEIKAEAKKEVEKEVEKAKLKKNMKDFLK